MNVQQVTLNSKKIIVISGASGYVGSAVAKKLAGLGFKIAALYNNAPEKVANALFGSLSGTGHAIYKCNLNNKDEVLAVIKKILETQGKDGQFIYGCIHAAWTKPERRQISKCISEDIMKQINENIPGSFNFISSFASLFKKQQKGFIVGITTAGVVNGHPIGNLAGYIPAKYALQGILSSYKEELSAFGVRVYSVAPDFMEGGMNKDIPKAFIDIIKHKSPSHSLITAEDIAGKIAQLCDSKIEEAEFTHLITPHAI